MEYTFKGRQPLKASTEGLSCPGPTNTITVDRPGDCEMISRRLTNSAGDVYSHRSKCGGRTNAHSEFASVDRPLTGHSAEDRWRSSLSDPPRKFTDMHPYHPGLQRRVNSFAKSCGQRGRGLHISHETKSRSVVIWVKQCLHEIASSALPDFGKSDAIFYYCVRFVHSLAPIRSES